MTWTFFTSPKRKRGSPFPSLTLRVGMLIAALAPTPTNAEEIYLQDGKRLMAMVEAVGADGKMTLRLPSGRMQTADLAQVISITFRGREPRSIRAGTQEFHFVTGDRLRGQIARLDGDTLLTEAPAVGNQTVPLAALRGFLTMPLEGKAGRRAVELVTGDDDEPTGKMDQILDR